MALADRSDDFTAPALDAKWRVFNAAASWSYLYRPDGLDVLDILINTGGTAGMFWLDDDDGPLMYASDPVSGEDYIAGDFEVEVDLERMNLAGDGDPPTHNLHARIGGPAAHLLPHPTDANPGVDQYTYFHAGHGQAGGANGGDDIVFEHKRTIADVTVWDTISRAPGRCRLMLRRVGSTLEVLARMADWTRFVVLYRGSPSPLLLRPLAVGLMAYSSAAAPDLRVRFHSITYRTPGNKMATSTYASTQMLGGTAPPATLYLAFSTTVPALDGTNVTEPVGSNYSRTAVTFDAAAAGQRLVQGPVSLPVPSATWGQGYWCLYDAASGGNLWLWDPTQSAEVVSGVAPTVADEALVLDLTGTT
ncbi:MAG: phage tail fiber protein [Nannocystales bacterium]